MRRAIAYGVALLIAAYALVYIPTGYYMVAPGEVRDLSGVVTVDGGSKRRDGRLFIVTVSTRQANAVIHLYGLINPAVGLRPKGQFLPPGKDEKEYFEESRRMMRESQEVAKVAALKKLGYDARLSGEGARVVEVMEGSPAGGVLQPGDVIVGVDGRPVEIADDLVREMKRFSPGEEVELDYIRGGKRTRAKVSCATHPEDPGRAALLLRVETSGWAAVVPVRVSIDTGDITGPSGGLMLALEIIRQMNPAGDITAGGLVAGTGTIAPTGEVGPVGGVMQKVIAAERAGATVFFAPVENADEAMRAARRIRVVPVSTLDDALRYLEQSGGAPVRAAAS